MRQRRPEYKFWLVMIGVPLIFAAAWLYPYIPGHDVDVCAVKLMLGLDCPGCGFIRSFSAFAHGDLRGSVNCNPMGIVSVVILIYLWLKVCIVRSFLGGRSWVLVGPFGARIISYAFAAGLFIQWFFNMEV